MIGKSDRIAFFPAAEPNPSIPPVGEVERPLLATGRKMDRVRSNGKFRWWRKRAVIGATVAVVVILVIAAFFLPARNSLVVEAISLDRARGRLAPFRDYVPLRAEVTPLETVILTAVQGGQVRRLIGTDGGLVHAGAPLAEISNPQFRIAIASQEAEIISRLSDISGRLLGLQRGRRDQQRELATAEQDLIEAQDQYRKQMYLSENNLVSKARIEPLASKVRFLRGRVDALKQGSASDRSVEADQAFRIDGADRQLRANLQTVRDTLDALVLRAPVDGRLTNFKLKTGQTVASGEAVGQIDSEGANKLIAEVDEFYLGRVAPGQIATALVEGRDSRLVVTSVDPQVTAGRFKVELEFRSAASKGLRRGQSVDLQIKLGDTRRALVVPNGAWNRGGGASVAFVVAKDGAKAERRSITVGRSNPEQVEILSGLHPGETIIVSNTNSFGKYQTLILR